MALQHIDVPFEVKAADIKEDGTFRGYASLFDRKPDSHNDLISKGAFLDSIATGGRNKSGIAMLWQHQTDQIPGVWVSLQEDNKGLVSEGRLALNTTLGKDIYEIMKLSAEVGTFRLGQSIGYDAVEYEVDEKKRIRDLKKIDLWEISLVTFPAKIGASVLTVKSIEEAKTPRELEDLLREAGLSNSIAKYLVSLCKSSLRDAGKLGSSESGLLAEILASLTQTNEELEKFHKSVIPFKSYPLADEDTVWEASVETKRACITDMVDMCTWYDPNNKNEKGSYKLLHHTQNGGATVWRGVANAMATLLQPGGKIPAGDRKECYTHLAKHYEEFKKPVPEFKEYDDREWLNLFSDYATGIGFSEILESLNALNL
jgi:HK97 family phage prohead protease